jgi:Ca2+-binding RTX toxin-like protein
VSRSPWPARAGLALLASVTTAGVLAAPAQAAPSGIASVVESTKIQYKAGSKTTNKVVVTRSGNTVTIDDVVAVKPGKGCTRVDRSKVRCSTRKAPTRVRVYLGANNDSVINKADLPMTAGGGDGNDKITGGLRADSLSGGDGKDRIWGGAGNDRLDGGSGADRLHGGPGDDSLMGHLGNDYLYGEAGRDAVSGDEGNDKEYGGAGEDRLYQNPIPYAKTGADLVSGGSGVDFVSYQGRSKAIAADLDGAKGDDGEAGEHDTLLADLEGIEGGDGNDRLTGHAGYDLLNGGPGNDTLRGLGGNDFLSGDRGQDRLEGGDGHDELAGDTDPARAAADTLLGGKGLDTVDYYAYARPISVDLDGAPRDDGQAGEHDTVGSDVEIVNGGQGSDHLTGNAAGNRLFGGSGNDVLRGGAGADLLSGDDGADSLYGEAGDDWLDTGGGGYPEADHLDGGGNATEKGDNCWADAVDVATDCEYAELYWPGPVQAGIR